MATPPSHYAGEYSQEEPLFEEMVEITASQNQPVPESPLDLDNYLASLTSDILMTSTTDSSANRAQTTGQRANPASTSDAWANPASTTGTWANPASTTSTGANLASTTGTWANPASSTGMWDNAASTTSTGYNPASTTDAWANPVPTSSQMDNPALTAGAMNSRNLIIEAWANARWSHPAPSTSVPASPASTAFVTDSPISTTGHWVHLDQSTSVPASPAPNISQWANPAPFNSVQASPAPNTSQWANPAPFNSVQASPAPNTSQWANPAPFNSVQANPAPNTSQWANLAPSTSVPASPAPNTSQSANPAPATSVPPSPAPNTGPSANPNPSKFSADLVIPDSKPCTCCYSKSKDKIYVKHEVPFSMEFDWDHALHSGPMRVRQTLIYDNPSQAHHRVEVCMNHKALARKATQLSSNSDDVALGDSQPVVVSTRGGRDVTYHGDPADPTSHFSIVVDLKRNADGVYQHSYKSMCSVSCYVGIRRCHAYIIFTLEDQWGQVVGRRKIHFKPCSSPGRDYNREHGIGPRTQRAVPPGGGTPSRPTGPHGRGESRKRLVRNASQPARENRRRQLLLRVQIGATPLAARIALLAMRTVARQEYASATDPRHKAACRMTLASAREALRRLPQ